jgi:hypothetical protein
MKRLLATLLLLVCGLASLGASGPVQTLNIDETMKVSEIGDCDIAINFTLTAAQYAMWNQKYGQNPSLLRRDFGKLVSQYDTHDWKVDAKAMERQVAISLRAYGVVTHNGGGNYQFEVPKNWRGGQVNNNAVDYNYAESLGPGVLAQYNCKVILPASATGIKDDTGASGERLMRYSVPAAAAPARAGWLWLVPTVLGLLICLLGVGIMGIGVFTGSAKKKA